MPRLQSTASAETEAIVASHNIDLANAQICGYALGKDKFIIAFNGTDWTLILNGDFYGWLIIAFLRLHEPLRRVLKLAAEDDRHSRLHTC